MQGNGEAGNRERLLDPKLLQTLGNMRIRAQSVVEGTVAGLHQSALKGASAEFAEYKEYTPGDDIRHIDWRTFARSDRYYVKQFEDETNLRVYLLLDTSASMSFGFEDSLPKHTYATYLSAALAYLFSRQGDAVGLLTFDHAPRVFLPASTKRSHLDDLFEVLDQPLDPVAKTDLTAALTAMAERAPRRSLVLLLSDMLDTAPSALNAAKVLRRRKNEVVVFHLVDPAELSLPYEGLTLFEGMEEDGELLVDPDDIRTQYIEELQAWFEEMARQCRESNLGYWRVLTTTPLERVLMDFIHARARRRRR